MKQQFVNSLCNRFFIRFHMSLILAGMMGAGFLSSKLLFIMGLENIVIRYPLSLVISYLTFFGLIKLWLAYVLSSSLKNSENNTDLDDWDFFDLLLSRKSSTKWSGNGGGFSGGGSSGSWDGKSQLIDGKTQVTPVFIPSENSSSSLDFKMPDLDLGDDEAAIPIALLIFIAAVVIAMIGASAYFIVEAPLLLGDIAFQMALSVGILKSKERQIHPYSWMQEAFSKTCVAFGIFLVLTIGVSFAIHETNPEITNSKQLMEWISRSEETKLNK